MRKTRTKKTQRDLCRLCSPPTIRQRAHENRENTRESTRESAVTLMQFRSVQYSILCLPNSNSKYVSGTC